MNCVDSDNQHPLVSVIVPARNEAENLPACLKSILVQDDVPFEVIVVDDNSTDKTFEIASSYPGVHVMRGKATPPGWSGKSYAISKGVQSARGAWLLFTD